MPALSAPSAKILTRRSATTASSWRGPSRLESKIQSAAARRERDRVQSGRRRRARPRCSRESIKMVVQPARAPASMSRQRSPTMKLARGRCVAGAPPRAVARASASGTSHRRRRRDSRRQIASSGSVAASAWLIARRPRASASARDVRLVRDARRAGSRPRADAEVRPAHPAGISSSAERSPADTAGRRGRRRRLSTPSRSRKTARARSLRDRLPLRLPWPSAPDARRAGATRRPGTPRRAA